MIKLNVNNKEHSIDVKSDERLLWVLRDHLNLKGAKFGCGIAQCGACKVHINGQALPSCIIPVGSVVGSEITTIEGLAETNGKLHPVQKAWVEENVPQCGYCQPGQIMAAAALLDNNSNPSDEEIKDVMSGNVCRCGTYDRIKTAIKSLL